jgi:anti-sigma factor RsiW
MHRGKPPGTSNDQALRGLVDAIIANQRAVFSKMIGACPALATAAFQHGATRQGPSGIGSKFLSQIGHYINSGDTALHVAAAAYRAEMVSELIKAGAQVRSKNRLGTEPLHLAAVGGPNSPRWNPPTQSATIACLVKAGGDPNAKNKNGATPLHRAVRTRCADAVRTLLEYGADPSIRTKNGSTAKDLAIYTTGRPGSGSPEAKAQQREILLMLEGRSQVHRRGDLFRESQ